MLGFYRTYTTPFKEEIYASVEDFFQRVPIHKRFMRFFGRYLYAEIKLIKSQKLNRINNQHKRILWVQWVDSYLGDSLMDLSSRILFKDKHIDLLTKENTAKIYQNDCIFERIFTCSKQCNAKDYDLLIIDSYRQRSLKILTQDLIKLPHVSLYGYYNVDDFNRLYFSFYRINYLLSKPHSFEYIQRTAKPLLTITSTDIDIVDKYNLPNHFITIAIGGANKERTYLYWLEVVQTLLNNNIAKNIVLIGQSNAKKEAKIITKLDSSRVIDMVAICSFNQTAEVINRSEILICCDGGLLHAANAVQTPVVGLFYRINPKARTIKINPSYTLLNLDDINKISPKEIIKIIMWNKETR